MFERFIVTLNVPNNKIKLIKMYRKLTGVGLKEAKDFIEAYVKFPPNDHMDAPIHRFNVNFDMSAAALGRFYEFIFNDEPNGTEYGSYFYMEKIEPAPSNSHIVID